MAKAKQELGETIGFGQSIEEKDIPRLPYLQALLKEAIGYTIPKHTQVFVNAWACNSPRTYVLGQANTICTRKVNGHAQWSGF